jgi:LuxR family maltose regulon positive regulatory protein
LVSDRGRTGGLAFSRAPCASANEARYLNEFDHLTLVRLLLARHQAHQDTGSLDQAPDLFDRLCTAAETAERAGSLLEIQLQVLRLLDRELTGPQIARELFLSQNTVRTHTKHIFTKPDVTNRRAAVLRAREHGLI